MQVFAFGDIDGDDDEDLIIANVGQNQVLINDGNGFFTSETELRIALQNTTTRAMVLVDIDRDKDLDLIVANSNQEQNQVFINDSNGVFTETTAKALPVLNDTSSDVKTFDINFDGYPDLIFANSVPNPGGPATGGHPLAPAPNVVYLNNGRGVFTDASSEFLPDNNDISFDIEIGDVNGDRLNDILISNANDGEEQLYIRDLTPPTAFNRVIPFAKCITKNEDGTFTGIFGYVNFNAGSVYIPEGERNMIIVDNNNSFEQLPVVFLRGIVGETFSVTFEDSVTWKVNTRTTLANGFINRCDEDDNTITGTRKLIEEVKNYPNPFSSSSTIEYTLSKSSNVQIVIYNQFGSVLQEELKTNMDKGKHHVPINSRALGLTPGIYFYEISAESFTSVKSFIIKK